eukprot:1930633-Rhodomonas_salina.1
MPYVLRRGSNPSPSCNIRRADAYGASSTQSMSPTAGHSEGICMPHSSSLPTSACRTRIP